MNGMAWWRSALLCGLCVAGLNGALAAQDFRSTQPTERIEYWQKRLAEIDTQLAQPETLHHVKVLFLGDSITDFWTMAENPWFPGKSGGRAIWDQAFGLDSAHPSLNFGISGDRTEHLLYRIQPKAEGGLGQLDRPDLQPEVIVLLIGINNSWDAESPAVDSVLAGIQRVVESVHARKPDAQIVLQSLLPTSEAARNSELVLPVNAALAEFAAAATRSDYLHYLDLYPAFLDAAGEPNSDFYMDGVHPNEQGYAAWRDKLQPVLDALRRNDH